MQRAVDAVIKNSLLSFFRVLGQGSRSLSPTITRIELVGVYWRLLAHQELAKALDKEVYRDTDGLASRGRGTQSEYKVSPGDSGSSAMQRGLGGQDHGCRRVQQQEEHSHRLLVPSAVTTASPKSHLLGSCACPDGHHPLTSSKSELPSVGKQMVLLFLRGKKVSSVQVDDQGSGQQHNAGC